MRTIRPAFSCGLFLVVAASAGAQTGAPYSSQMNALGGSFASAGMARPLGGIRSGNGGSRGGSRRAPASPLVSPYGYSYGYSYGSSYYAPGYFDPLFDYSTPSSVATYDSTSPVILPPRPQAVYGPQFAGPAPQTAPSVVINQYFNGAPAGGPQHAADAAGETPRTSGEPLGPVENYYLIAYKDHQVYAVLAYWLEDKTLHYVTTHNVHNQASLDLIDLDLTKSLNQARDVPFTLSAH